MYHKARKPALGKNKNKNKNKKKLHFQFKSLRFQHSPQNPVRSLKFLGCPGRADHGLNFPAKFRP
jgi:hypothetical protein